MAIKWNEIEIQNRIKGNYDHEYQLTNSYVFAWESDYFGVSKSGYIYEVEIKLSISDFRADFNKLDKHICLKNSKIELVTLPTEEETVRVKKGEELGRHGYTHSVFEQEPAGYCPLRIRKNHLLPNRFFYCVPEEIWEKAIKLVPEYAGLIYIKDCGTLVPIKGAPWLHRRKLMDKLMRTLLNKFYHLSVKQNFDIYELKSDLKKANKEWYYPTLENF